MFMAVVSGCIWVATIVFLFVCVWRNQRTGYRKPSQRVSLLAEGWAWLEEIKHSLDEQAPGRARARQVSETFPAEPPDTGVEQLARLGLALQVNLAAPVSLSSQTKSQQSADECATPDTRSQVSGSRGA